MSQSNMLLPVHGDLDTHLIMAPLAHTGQLPNGISIGSAVFAQLTQTTRAKCDM